MVRVSTTGTENNYTNNEATTTAVVSGAPPSLVTRASIRGFAANPQPDASSSPRGRSCATRAFNFYATDDLTGRTGRVAQCRASGHARAQFRGADSLHRGSDALHPGLRGHRGGRARRPHPRPRSFAVGDPVNADTWPGSGADQSRGAHRGPGGRRPRSFPSHDSGRLARLSPDGIATRDPSCSAPGTTPAAGSRSRA